MNNARWEDIKRELENANGEATRGIVKNVVSDIEELGTPAQKRVLKDIKARVGEVDEDEPHIPLAWRNNLLGEINNPRSPMWVDRQYIQGNADGGPGGGRRRRHRKTRRHHRKARKHPSGKGTRSRRS